ncbi:MAG: hypothetical protein HOM68_06915 [Gemmatimonadetes bacterium]|jgi:flagellar motor switch protein FliN|nr:hypothetical protein [Gemmatimonadota bacterium]MBT4613468.1 hypothetical protein [Gemmatimonadota bacterium]MBT5056252.1 hypothetical protein [Gemmatimonadota bacterium]MBT5144927.1 hypothetical protein [Gemmatimonadota bacterium]MBT5587323.1 hypothetical protein [Gemmatimonadota bacterium]
MATNKAKSPKKKTKAVSKAAKKSSSKLAPTKVSAASTTVPRDNIDVMGKLNLTVTAELGRTRETIGKVREIGDQSLIELDKSVGEPVDLLLNGELFARGEVVTVSENFGVRITEIVRQPGD